MSQLISPFPPESLPEAWAWLNQFPHSNFDDFGPKTYEEFVLEMDRREGMGEHTWGAVDETGEPVGIIGYRPIVAFTGCFHGVCFDKRVHGTGIAKAAVAETIRQLMAGGVEKISASYFADNHRIHAFMKRLGARNEGYLRNQTIRGGKFVDMRLIAFYKENH
jgi:RimJ/RimL family protein N-acetyltransferase